MLFGTLLIVILAQWEVSPKLSTPSKYTLNGFSLTGSIAREMLVIPSLEKKPTSPSPVTLALKL